MVGAPDLDQMLELALVEHDGVEIELLQIFRRLLLDGDAAILAMRPGVVEAAPIAGDIAAAMGDADLQFGKTFEIAVEHQLPDAQRGIQRMSDRVREIMILHAPDQAGAERMQEDHHVEFLDAGEEFFQARAGEVDTPDIGAEFDAAEAELFDGAVEFGNGHAGILQRHRAHAHQPVGMFCDHVGDMVVDHMAAVARHFRRRRIDEMAGIGRDHLHVDAVAVHVGEPGLEIGQFRKIDLAALRLDAFGQIVDMGVGVRRLAAARMPVAFSTIALASGTMQWQWMSMVRQGFALPARVGALP